MTDRKAAPQSSVVAVLGSGTMGHGIAHVSAAAGHKTRLYDLQADLVASGLEKIRGNLDKGVARGKVTATDAERALGNLQGTTSLAEAVRGASIVIEAIPERLDLKRQVFTEVCRLVGEDTILGTNTSSLSIARIADAMPGPERFVGLHFFNPVHIMKLLEIITGPQTSAEVLAQARAFGEGLGKECIVVRDSPGFATSRLGLVIGLEAIRMVEEKVASAEDIDKAMTLGYGFPMGPLRLTDLVGLDVRLHIAEYLQQNLRDGAHFEPPQLLRDMVAAGKLGKKSGQGFYSW